MNETAIEALKAKAMSQNSIFIYEHTFSFKRFTFCFLEVIIFRFGEFLTFVS